MRLVLFDIGFLNILFKSIVFIDSLFLDVSYPGIDNHLDSQKW